MDIPLRTETLRSIDTEPRPGIDSRGAADAGVFGDMLAEVRQREIPGDEDRDSPPPGSEAAFAAQVMPVPPRQPSPGQEESRADGAADSETATAVVATGSDGGNAEGAEPLTAQAPVTSPESFASLLESSAASLATTSLQTAPGDTPAGLALPATATAAPATQPPSPPQVTAVIAPPLQSPAWPAAFNNTMRVLVTDQTQVARLQLTPGDLGPVDVRIAISEHRAEIAFAVSSPEAKAAIQQALPQLRETFAASGLELGDATFGESQRGGTGDPSKQGAGPSDGPRGTVGEAALLPPARAVGLIDLYA